MDAVGPALCCLLALVAVPTDGASEHDALRRQAARIVAAGSLQRDLPGEPPSDPADRADSASAAASTPPEPKHGHDDPSARSSNAATSAPSDAGSIAQPLMIVGAVVLVLLAIWIFLSRRSAALAPDVATVRPHELASAPAPAAAEPESLACAGRFAEAVHRLLLQVLATLAPALPTRTTRGTTSREFVPRVPDLPRREALRELVATVERSRFGDRPIGAPEWRRSVELAAAATAAATTTAANAAKGDERRG